MKHSSILLRGILPAVLISLLVCPADGFAQAPADDHIVTSQALQLQVELSSAERQKDVATVTDFLSTPIAERAMHDSHFDATQVRAAIPTLSDRELKDLATRATDAQQKFAAGGLTNAMLTLIIIAVVVIIVVAIIH
jgi:hypothetical protein